MVKLISLTTSYDRNSALKSSHFFLLKMFKHHVFQYTDTVSERLDHRANFQTGGKNHKNNIQSAAVNVASQLVILNV